MMRWPHYEKRTVALTKLHSKTDGTGRAPAFGGHSWASYERPQMAAISHSTECATAPLGFEESGGWVPGYFPRVATYWCRSGIDCVARKRTV